MKIPIILSLLILIVSVNFAQIDQQGYYSYLHESYTKHESDIYEFLIGEFNLYLVTYPDSPNADEVLFMLGSLYDDHDDHEQAFCTFLKLKFIFPQSVRVNDAVTAINDIVHNKSERTFSDFKTRVDSIVTNTPILEDKMTAGYAYLNSLYELNMDDINDFLVIQINTYLHLYPKEAKNSDQLFLWMAELYERDHEWDEAIYTLTKITHLYPESTLLPEVLFKTAYIQYKEKSAYALARDSFIRVITDYSEHEVAGEAQFYLAELYEKELDNQDEAIANYRILIETFPKNTHAVEALKRVAGIYDNADQYDDAVSAFYQIYELYPGDIYAPDALIEIRDLYQDRLKNYEKAIEILKLFATQYPDREDAAERLYEAAEIYEDDLEFIQAAIDTYHEVKNKFPNSSYAERAQDRIDDLSQQ